MSDTNTPPASDPNLTIPDFLPRPTTDKATVEELTAFFNRPQIKQELHWFTRRETLQRAYRREDREIFYIRPQDTIITAAMVWCESRVLDDDQAQIRLVATAPGYRQRGLARMLVESAVRFARIQGKGNIIADVDALMPATEFWTKCQFSAVDEYETDSGRTMIQMKREI